jgi:hypothetical protein
MADASPPKTSLPHWPAIIRTRFGGMPRGTTTMELLSVVVHLQHMHRSA